MIAPSNEVPPGPCAVGRYSHHVTAAINVTLLWSFQFDCPEQDNVRNDVTLEIRPFVMNFKKSNSMYLSRNLSQVIIVRDLTTLQLRGKGVIA